MDILKFNNPASPTKMEQAQIIDGFKSKMWVERYLEAGEFTFVASLDSGMKEKLPIGSFISHVNTPEVMIVEDHQISEQDGSDSEITITGRSFETILSDRVVGSNINSPQSHTASDYVINANYVWNQIVSMINNHIITGLIDANDTIPYISVIAQIWRVSDVTDVSVPRGDLYLAVLNLLKIENLGIKNVRPGLWSPLTPGDPNTTIIIHEGTDRTNDVVFSYDTGEVDSAKYLWSSKQLKNRAYVVSKWLEIIVGESQSGIYRKTMYVDASDVDNQYTSTPVGSNYTKTIDAMTQRGIAALAAQNNIAIMNADVSKNGVKAKYREDFDLGDLIVINGDYDQSLVRRVSEYVEIEDEFGESGYPTLIID